MSWILKLAETCCYVFFFKMQIFASYLIHVGMYLHKNQDAKVKNRLGNSKCNFKSNVSNRNIRIVYDISVSCFDLTTFSSSFWKKKDSCFLLHLKSNWNRVHFFFLFLIKLMKLNCLQVDDFIIFDFRSFSYFSPFSAVFDRDLEKSSASVWCSLVHSW